MTCESADSGDSADAAERGQSHASKGKEQSSSKRCPTHQSKRYSCSGQCVAGALLADDLWSRCGVSLSPQRSRKQSRRSAGSIWNRPQWRRERQGNSLLAKKHPWALLTVCWQCAQPLEILIATERHALFRERSDHDEAAWTCSCGHVPIASESTQLRGWCEASPSCGTKSDAAGRALLVHYLGVLVPAVFSHSCTWSRYTGPIHTCSFSRLLGVHLPSVTLSHISRSRSLFALVSTYIFEAGFADKSEPTSLCHRSRHVP